jgi:prevent-host-death family protein
MKTISLAEAKTHLSELLDRVQAGEEVLVTRHGRPVARIQGAKRRSAPFRSLADFRAGLKPSRVSSAALLRQLRDASR